MNVLNGLFLAGHDVTAKMKVSVLHEDCILSACFGYDNVKCLIFTWW